MALYFYWKTQERKKPSAFYYRSSLLIACINNILWHEWWTINFLFFLCGKLIFFLLLLSFFYSCLSALYLLQNSIIILSRILNHLDNIIYRIIDRKSILNSLSLIFFEKNNVLVRLYNICLVVNKNNKQMIYERLYYKNSQMTRFQWGNEIYGRDFALLVKRCTVLL